MIFQMEKRIERSGVGGGRKCKSQERAGTPFKFNKEKEREKIQFHHD